MRQTLLQTFKLIHSDMSFRCEYEHKSLNFWRVIAFLCNPTVFSQVIFRFQGFFYTHHLSLVASLIESICSILFTVRIHSSAKIGPGLLILHANYINIDQYVTIGKKCIFAQQNVITPAFTKDCEITDKVMKGPTLGDHILLGVGCVITGDVYIGNHSKIGINSAVDKSFPEHSILIGVPARNVNLN